ncbi:LysR substrate-binding domain-containing protein [Paracraurococcus lichenis]|uniref:LysR substrate-binding domain-containing protein n=1 Tax=Paracraurococcus lichenis TaxID=3064888 RepID=A0ABT9E9N0_9PROT|nr:LysR substrate-binding domain-containing protein [Paracraurococcus sp. LOR1-02]MDO9712912.1 LysR substrate-binding domain-containing protein [Paracraurococcus sp. LOR1-02]
MQHRSLELRLLRSFLCVAETRSVTETARRMGRSQPAITLQIAKLEEQIGRKLFRDDTRRPSLTNDGDMVLSYAKAILQLHDEMLGRLSAPDVEGHVVLGTPDLYAAYLLPSILALFRESFPRIQVELRCSLSTPLVGLVQRGEVDIALVTRMRGFTGGELVREEPLVWIEGEGHQASLMHPVPLALLPPGNIYRDHAIEQLERAGRKWRIACISDSVGGLQAAVFAGMAVTVLGRSAVVAGMQEIHMPELFPPLPKVGLLLYEAPGLQNEAAKTLHRYLSRYIRLEDDLALPALSDPGWDASPARGVDRAVPAAPL